MGASRSSAITVTRAPSGNATPSSGTIAPAFTRAVKTCMDMVYLRRIVLNPTIAGSKGTDVIRISFGRRR